MAVGCGNNQRSTNSSMNEEEFQKYDSVKHEEGMIAIETTFEPTLELTDEIKNATLEDLIIQGKGKLSKADQERQDAYMKKFREDMRKEGSQGCTRGQDPCAYEYTANFDENRFRKVGVRKALHSLGWRYNNCTI